MNVSDLDGNSSGSSNSREEIYGHGLKDRLNKDESPHEIKSSEGPVGSLLLEFRDERFPVRGGKGLFSKRNTQVFGGEGTSLKAQNPDNMKLSGNGGV